VSLLGLCSHCVPDDTSLIEVSKKNRQDKTMKMTETMKNNKRLIQATAIVALIAAWVSIPLLNGIVKADSTPVVVLRNAILASPTGSINPHGTASWTLYQSGNREIQVEAQDTSLAQGTVLNAIVDGSSIGTMTVDSVQRAKITLKTENGQAVPVVNDGSTVEVRNGATVLVNGVFGGGGPTPTPTVSPTVSPTGTPSPSPTVSPTGTPSPSPSPTGTPNANQIYAILNGPTINGALPRGYSEYEIHSSRTELETRIYQVSLPAGTSLSVFVNDIAVGNIVLQSGGEGRQRLRSDNGDTVPVVTAGSTIAIKNGGTTILSGTYAMSGGPTPTPTGTPQGRSFEGHLNGAGVTPPVTTNATGEIEVLLNADESQATIFGEFNRFTSAQTSALIQVTVAGTTTTVANLGTVPSSEGEGHFAPMTVNVTPLQVQLLRMGSWIAVIGSANNPAGEVQGAILNDSHHADFDGDGNHDFAVFRPSTGTWFVQNGQGFTAQNFGTATDIPVSADYDGDGKTDRAVVRNVGGSAVWEINRSSDGGVTSTQFGFASDKPVRGDFDGDGRNDIAVYRPTTGVWFVQRSNGTGYQIVQFGSSEDIPMSTDMDGDGRSDVTVFRPSTGVWYSINSSNGSIAIAKFGQLGDKPIKGDFDGDGRDDLSIYRPSTGVWYIMRSSNGSFDIRQFGTAEDIPVAGNYDGDNQTDLAVFRPSTGDWYIWRSIDNSYEFRHFGLTGDVPTAN